MVYPDLLSIDRMEFTSQTPREDERITTNRMSKQTLSYLLDMFKPGINEALASLHLHLSKQIKIQPDNMIARIDMKPIESESWTDILWDLTHPLDVWGVKLRISCQDKTKLWIKGRYIINEMGRIAGNQTSVMYKSESEADHTPFQPYTTLRNINTSDGCLLIYAMGRQAKLTLMKALSVEKTFNPAAWDRDGFLVGHLAEV